MNNSSDNFITYTSRLYSFEADDEIVDLLEKCLIGLENFPYHYNDKTYHDLAEKLRGSQLYKKNLTTLTKIFK